jgi:hypothetical protein
MKTDDEVLNDVVTRLERLGIAYMLTGSFAMLTYAEPRMTRDIDMVIQVQKSDALKLVAAFEPDYYALAEEIEMAVETNTMFNLIHQATVTKIDCIVRKTGEYRELEFERRRKTNFRGISFFIVSKEDLILSKLDWMKDSLSELQRRDVQNLLNSGYDNDYLHKWADKLGLRDLLKQFTEPNQ